MVDGFSISPSFFILLLLTVVSLAADTSPGISCTMCSSCINPCQPISPPPPPPQSSSDCPPPPSPPPPASTNYNPPPAPSGGGGSYYFPPPFYYSAPPPPNPILPYFPFYYHSPPPPNKSNSWSLSSELIPSLLVPLFVSLLRWAL